ncbi:MAG: hypothetical protein AB7I30_21580, partial [Isosphaeraceae bacterium]
LYRPIKAVLAEALRQGTLPFWSDQFGIGVPLAAESHAASFYPPNWLIYRALGVSAAYRLAMWLSELAIVAATFGYARVLGISPWGAAVSALAFALCGFLMSHACHEPFYNLLPYLPLALILAERYMARGGAAWLAGVALTVGAQLTLGHFQIQMWTAGLVVLTGLWRAFRKEGPWRRALGLVVAVAWGGAVASAQLGLTWELTRIARFDRPPIFLTNYAFPPAHWAQPALPRLFMHFQGGSTSPYWYDHATSPDEACLYVGTAVLILAVVGALAKRDRALAPWRWLSVIALILATMPGWFPEGYLLVLRLPGLGHFRAPGRYALLTSLGLCLLAGRGFDLARTARRFWRGYALAIVLGASAFAWAAWWSSRPDVREAIGGEVRDWHLVEAAVAWTVALVVVAVYRARPGKATAWVLLLTIGVELAYLFHHGTVPWGWSVDFPASSPVFQRLGEEPRVGLVAGELQDVVVRGGHATAWPNLGIVAPPPNYLLEASGDPAKTTPELLNWLKRFGVSHGVFDGPRPFRSSEVLYFGPDPALDAILPPRADRPLPRTYRLERYPEPFPHARTALRTETAADWYEIYPALSRSADPDVVWFLKEHAPVDSPEPRALNARVVSWDGRSGVVEHDGTVDLVIRRTYYPGWSARLDDGSEVPVTPADGGLQSVRLPGVGPTRVTLRYQPTFLIRGVALSLLATSAAVLVIARGAWPARRRPG